jgi:hypothetical protein
MARRRRRVWKIILGILIALLIGLVYAAWPGSSTFTVSPETTYVTGPIDKHGYVDYVSALNERLRGNIKPEENANVLIWQALGPHPEGGTMPPEYFVWLGVPEPPEQGEYWVGWQKFLKDRLGDEFLQRSDDLDQRQGRAMKWPWAVNDEPEVADWINRNRDPMALVTNASRRSDYYNPLVPKGRTEDWSPGLWESLLPNVQKCREVAAALVARALLQLKQRRMEQSWIDLLATHRLGRLMQRGGTLIEMLVGIAIEAIAGKAELVFLDKCEYSAQQIRKCWSEIRDLPAMPTVAEKVDLTERINCLDTLMSIVRHGTPYMERLASSTSQPSGGNQFRARLFTHSIDWDPAFRNVNVWFDRCAAGARILDQAARKKEMDQITRDLKNLKLQVGDIGLIEKELMGPKQRGEMIGNILVALLIPAFDKVAIAAERTEQNLRNLHLAFALAAYHADNRRYPETLAELAPNYIDKIPDDLFSGHPLIYRLEGDGYLLYSVGVNGIDDGGQGYDDDPKGDDLVIRMPVPEPKLKK